MRYGNFSFYVMKFSYDLSSPIFQHLIFVERAINIYIHKSDMKMKIFYSLCENMVDTKTYNTKTCKFQCIIKYKINHDLPPFCQTTTFRKINCEELTELIKIFMRCYTFLNKQRCLQVTLLGTQLRFFLIISQKFRQFNK